LILMALATISFVVQDFTFASFTKVVDTPSLQASAGQEHLVRVPLFVDCILFLSGLAMVIFGARSTETN